MKILPRLQQWAADNNTRHIPGIRIRCGEISLSVRSWCGMEELQQYLVAGWNARPEQRAIAVAFMDEKGLGFKPQDHEAYKQLRILPLDPSWRDLFLGVLAFLLGKVVLPHEHPRRA